MPDTSYTLQSTPHYKEKELPYLNDIPSDSGTGNLNYNSYR